MGKLKLSKQAVEDVMPYQSFALANRATHIGMDRTIRPDAIGVVNMAANQRFIWVVEEWLEADGALKD